MRIRAFGNTSVYLWFLLLIVIGALGINEYFRYRGQVGVTTVILRNATPANATSGSQSDEPCYNCYSIDTFEGLLSDVLGKRTIFNGAEGRIGMENRLALEKRNLQIATFYYEPYIKRMDTARVMLTNITDASKHVEEGGLYTHIVRGNEVFLEKINRSTIDFTSIITFGEILDYLPTGPDRERWSQYEYLNHSYKKTALFETITEHEPDIVETIYLMYDDYDVEFVRISKSDSSLLSYEVKPIRHINYVHNVAVRCNPALLVYVFSDPFETEPLLEEYVQDKVKSDSDSLLANAESILSACKDLFRGYV